MPAIQIQTPLGERTPIGRDDEKVSHMRRELASPVRRKTNGLHLGNELVRLPLPFARSRRTGIAPGLARTANRVAVGSVSASQLSSVVRPAGQVDSSNTTNSESGENAG